MTKLRPQVLVDPLDDAPVVERHVLQKRAQKLGMKEVQLKWIKVGFWLLGDISGAIPFFVSCVRFLVAPVERIHLGPSIRWWGSRPHAFAGLTMYGWRGNSAIVQAWRLR